MLGDGLGDESGGAWIKKEYRKISNSLLREERKNDPEFLKRQSERRQKKSTMVNEAMKKALENTKCECGSELKQRRSGTKIAYCTNTECNKRYSLGKKRK